MLIWVSCTVLRCFPKGGKAWLYAACRTCKKRLKRYAESAKVACQHCRSQFTPAYTYRLLLKVMDKSQVCQVILLGDPAQSLIGLEPEIFRKILLKATTSGENQAFEAVLREQVEGMRLLLGFARPGAYPVGPPKATAQATSSPHVAMASLKDVWTSHLQANTASGTAPCWLLSKAVRGVDCEKVCAQALTLRTFLRSGLLSSTSSACRGRGDLGNTESLAQTHDNHRSRRQGYQLESPLTPLPPGRQQSPLSFHQNDLNDFFRSSPPEISSQSFSLPIIYMTPSSSSQGSQASAMSQTSQALELSPSMENPAWDASQSSVSISILPCAVPSEAEPWSEPWPLGEIVQDGVENVGTTRGAARDIGTTRGAARDSHKLSQLPRATPQAAAKRKRKHPQTATPPFSQLAEKENTMGHVVNETPLHSGKPFVSASPQDTYSTVPPSFPVLETPMLSLKAMSCLPSIISPSPASPPFKSASSSQTPNLIATHTPVRTRDQSSHTDVFLDSDFLASFFSPSCR
eukprot:g76055.t1